MDNVSHSYRGNTPALLLNFSLRTRKTDPGLSQKLSDRTHCSSERDIAKRSDYAQDCAFVHGKQVRRTDVACARQSIAVCLPLPDYTNQCRLRQMPRAPARDNDRLHVCLCGMPRHLRNRMRSLNRKPGHVATDREPAPPLHTDAQGSRTTA